MALNIQSIIHEQGQLLALGALIKINRKKLNITQSALSKGICATSYLSKIENGEIHANEDVILLLLEALGIQYSSIKDFGESDIEKLNRYKEYVYAYDLRSAFDLFGDLIKKKEKYIYSPFIVEFYLIEYHYYLYNESSNDELPYIQDLMTSIEQLLSKDQQAFFYFLKSISSKSLEEQKYFIDKAITHEPHGRFYKELSKILIASGMYNDTIEALKMSLHLCLEEGNFRGLAYANLSLGEIYVIIGDYEKAEGYYDRNIRLITSSRTTDEYACSFIYYSYVNKANIAYMKSDSESLFKYCNLAKNYDKASDGKIHGVTHYLIECEYHLSKDKKKAADLLWYVKEKISTSITADHVIELGMTSLIEHRLENRDYLSDKTYLVKLREFKKGIIENGKYHYLSYIDKKLVEYYLFNKKYKDAYLISSGKK
ncbi:helix-turn-helix transcriptional regulator [Acidaminobacter sp. JC074]|uniref:helix-turn-helix domain-containing protein n=1 Tax=Acidaminobacter sp. JC074 TaxID=2530199 RepID=UPI001F10B150|nr:helix-turn-helix transcriptional regulator [Acidaminobacter sp. JC074]MCH4891374.1 helix-turn-helix transcriptional regulator [Acidaminobacter sp. JC074]